MLYYKAPYKLVRVKTRNKRMIWYMRFDDPLTGKVISKSTYFADKDNAESLCRKFVRENPEFVKALRLNPDLFTIYRKRALEETANKRLSHGNRGKNCDVSLGEGTAQLFDDSTMQKKASLSFTNNQIVISLANVIAVAPTPVFSPSEPSAEVKPALSLAPAVPQVSAPTMIPPSLSLPDTSTALSFATYAEPWWDWDRCPYVLAKKNRGTDKKPGIKKSTTDTNRGWVQHHMIPYFGNYSLSQIDVDIVNAFLIHLKNDTSLAPKSINNIRSILFTMMQTAVVKGLIATNPVAATMTLVDDREEPEIITKEEAEKLFDMKNFNICWKEDVLAYVINRTAAMTGMRLGELRALSMDDVSETEIRVTKNYNDHYGISTPKNNTSRVIPISRDIYIGLYAVNMNHEGGDFIFSRDGKKPICTSMPWKSLEAALAGIGISRAEMAKRKINFHGWRHFFTTQCVEANINPEMIRSVTGHKTPAMLSRYTNLNTSDMQPITDLQKNFLDSDSPQKVRK